VWDFDVTTGEVTWSKSIRDLNGVDAEAEASYEGFLALVHEEDRARVDRAVADACRSGG
jgi:hypothetical protein